MVTCDRHPLAWVMARQRMRVRSSPCSWPSSWVTLRARIKVLDKQIEHAPAAHADAAVFTSLPRAGTVRAATLLAEIGDARGRFLTEEALAAAAGVSPSTRASGRSRMVVFRHGCNRRLRQAVVDFADGSRKRQSLGSSRL